VGAITQVYVNDIEKSHTDGDLTGAFFKLTASEYTSGDKVSLDADGYKSGTTVIRNPIEIAKKILNELGTTYNDTNFDTATVAEAIKDADTDSLEMGLYVGELTSAFDIMTNLMKSCMGILYINNSGKYAFTIWDTDIPASPDTISDLEIRDGSFIGRAKIEDVRKVVRVGWRRNWSNDTYAYKQLTSDLAERVYGVTKSRTIATYLSNEDGVDIYLSRMRSIHETSTIEIQFTEKLKLAMKNIGDRISISFKRKEADGNFAWLDEKIVEISEIRKRFVNGEISIRADDLKGIGGQVGRWTDDDETFPTGLGGADGMTWDSAWSDAQAEYALQHWGYWTDDNEYIDSDDSRTFQKSKWW
jgi:hypothetical protein